MATGNKPVKEFRVGMLKAAIWENKHDKRSSYSVSFSKSYKDDKGQWQETTSFGQHDLPVLEKLAAKAFETICIFEA